MKLSDTLLKELLDKAEKATPGDWNYEDERYSARCVIGIKPRDDRWLGHFQPEMNGENNGLFVCAANPETVKSLVTCILEMKEALETCPCEEVCKGDCPSRILLEKFFGSEK